MDYNATISKILRGEEREKNSRLLFEKISSKIYFACSRYLNKEEEQNDSFQETMIKIFEKLSSFNPEKGDFEGWVYRIAVNNSISYFKKQQKYHLESSIDDDLIGELPSLDELSEFATDDICDIINTLPSAQRVVFNLHFVEGYSHKEIGSLLKISESTSRSNYYRARINLTKYYEKLNSEN